MSKSKANTLLTKMREAASNVSKYATIGNVAKDDGGKVLKGYKTQILDYDAVNDLYQVLGNHGKQCWISPASVAEITED